MSPKMNQSSEPMQKFECEICSKVLSSARTKAAHIKAIHEEKKHVCLVCGKKVVNATTLKLHVESVHEGKKRHQCDVCGDKFVVRVNLWKHVAAVHQKVRKYEYKVCGKKIPLAEWYEDSRHPRSLCPREVCKNGFGSNWLSIVQRGL